MRHGEAGIDLLGLQERFVGLLVLEAVKRRDAPEEFALRGIRSGGRKRDAAQAPGLRRQMGAKHQEK
jgi:hypothetical protein